MPTNTIIFREKQFSPNAARHDTDRARQVGLQRLCFQDSTQNKGGAERGAFVHALPSPFGRKVRSGFWGRKPCIQDQKHNHTTGQTGIGKSEEDDLPA